MPIDLLVLPKNNCSPAPTNFSAAFKRSFTAPVPCKVATNCSPLTSPPPINPDTAQAKPPNTNSPIKLAATIKGHFLLPVCLLAIPKSAIADFFGAPNGDGSASRIGELKRESIDGLIGDCKGALSDTLSATIG